MKKLLRIAIILMMALLANGCAQEGKKGVQLSGAQAGEQEAVTQQQRTASIIAQSDDVVVRLANMRFTPEEIRVKAGKRVVFLNDDSMEHDVVHDAGGGQALFSSPILKPGQSWAYTTTKQGTYALKCVVAGHYALGMVGTLVVE